MSDEVEEFKSRLRDGSTAKNICQDFIFSSEVWLLRQNFDDQCFRKNDEIRRFFADKLDVDMAGVCFVGSAKTGFSLSPHKNFRGFDNEKSDIDLVIVSERLFNLFWKLLLEARYFSSSWIGPEHSENIFRQFISLEPRRCINYGPEFRKWIDSFGEIQREFFVEFQISQPIKYRIYKSWKAVEMYHSHGIQKLMDAEKMK